MGRTCSLVYSTPLVVRESLLFSFQKVLTTISYNASVFQVVTGTIYTTNVLESASTEWHAMNDSLVTPQSKLKNLSIAEIKATYEQDYVSVHGDVVLYFDRVSFEYTQSSSHNQAIQNLTLPVIGTPLATPIQRNSSDLWVKAIGHDGWTNAAVLNGNWTVPFDGSLHLLRIQGAFAHPAVDCQIQLSLPFLLIVVVCNAIKVVCLISMLFRNPVDKDAPLVTVGDAVAGFLDDPDQSTRGYCAYSMAEYFWKTGRLKRTPAREEDGRAAKWDKRCEGVWERRINNYGSAISKRKRVILTFL